MNFFFFFVNENEQNTSRYIYFVMVLWNYCYNTENSIVGPLSKPNLSLLLKYPVDVQRKVDNRNDLNQILLCTPIVRL